MITVCGHGLVTAGWPGIRRISRYCTPNAPVQLIVSTAAARRQSRMPYWSSEASASWHAMRTGQPDA
jgi:hypothetical protein